jgi:hypothetical protein
MEDWHVTRASVDSIQTLSWAFIAMTVLGLCHDAAHIEDITDIS